LISKYQSMFASPLSQSTSKMIMYQIRRVIKLRSDLNQFELNLVNRPTQTRLNTRCRSIERRNPRERQPPESEKESEAEGIAVEKYRRSPELGSD
jgi:hypothetical protein